MEDLSQRIGDLEIRTKCENLRRAWLDARGEKLFYQKLMRVFAVAVLLFLVATLVLYYFDATRAGAGATFVTALISGALAVFFRQERDTAEAKEQVALTKYNEECPDGVRLWIEDA